MLAEVKMKKKKYLGQREVLLLESEPIMRYAKVQIIASGEIIDVCLNAIKDEKDKIKPIPLSWFGGAKDDK